MKELLNFFILSTVCAAALFAQSGPVIRRQPFLSGLSSPLFLTHAKDGSKRIFVVQQRGLIKVVRPGTNVATNFIDLASKVSQSGSERGLLGLAFHPQFATNSYFFVNYTRTSDGATVIERYKAINNNSIGDPTSGRVVITIPQDFSNHNGGMIEFGPDGNLYIGMGDGGSGNDPNNRAQNIDSLLGKILRITPDVSGNDANPAYTNPPDNPYVGIAGADEIYAIGVRNPFRWSFDRGGTNQLWAGDVGQNAIEEVDIITNGGNFGWRVYEGNSCTNNDPSLCVASNYTAPILTYTHAAGRCSITGGYVYRGGLGTFSDGDYLYGDYCTGEYWRWDGANQILMENTPLNISSFGEDEDGELYVVGLGGQVEKFIRASASADFDGDTKTDRSLFRPSDGSWYIRRSSDGGFRGQQFGLSGDIPAAEDFDGDNVTDIAVFRPSDGYWYYLRSSDSSFGGVQFGANGDLPAAGDYDGDSRSDFTVFRPSNGVWYTLRSSDLSFSAIQFGTSGDEPVAGDYDGDGRYDIAVWRPSDGVWYRLNSTNLAFSAVEFGLASDIPAEGDFDGDGKTDPAVYRPSNGFWYILQSSNNAPQFAQWGVTEDLPVTGDYDGDGKEDISVWRPSSGTWYVLNSGGGTSIGQFGQSGDLPVPAYDAP
jgi:glucose/arabinose dehydrogenase